MKSEAIIIDAKGRPLGRLASEAAVFLRGKGTAAYERHTAPDQAVIIKNAKFVRVTGRKMSQEYRERYSGYPGGLKKVSYKATFTSDPRELVRNAVSGMIPRTRLKKNILKNLTVYADDKN